MNAESGFTIFFGLCVVLSIGAWVFYWSSGIEAKRRWHPRIVLGGAAVFLAFVVMFFPASALIGAVPATGLAVAAALKLVRFCASCGQVLTRSSVWVSLNYCSSCGARLRDPIESAP